MNLLVTELIHSILSLLVGWYFWQSIGVAGVIAVLAAGFLVDSDHLFDYWLYVKDLKKFSIRQFLSSEHFKKSGKLYIVFHAWEYGLGMLMLGYGLKVPTLTAMGVSYLLHLTVDQATNDVRWKTYFVSYRWKVGWRNQCK